MVNPSNAPQKDDFADIERIMGLSDLGDYPLADDSRAKEVKQPANTQPARVIADVNAGTHKLLPEVLPKPQ